MISLDNAVRRKDICDVRDRHLFCRILERCRNLEPRKFGRPECLSVWMVVLLWLLDREFKVDEISFTTIS